MTILDGSIINVALPTIQRELGFTIANLQWIITGYALTYGGFLLFAGRASDLFGRRRLFLAGVILFSLASLLCGLAPSQLLLITSRLVQGVGGALLTPSALALIVTLFVEGPERNRALGIYGGLSALGAGIGALLGGLLTSTLGWRWVFFVNVPVGVLVIILTPFLLRKSTLPQQNRRIDIGGALLITTGFALLVYGATQASQAGVQILAVGVPLGLGTLLLIAFVLLEQRVEVPLIRLSIFRIRPLTGANLLSLLFPGLFGATLFLLTLYIQQVLKFSPLQTGLALLPLVLFIIISSAFTALMVGRLGLRPMLIGGIIAMALGLVLLTRIALSGTYLTSVLPGIIVLGIGFGILLNTTLIAATAGVGDEEQGLASGLINTANQVGTAVIIATLIATSAVRTHLLNLTARTSIDHQQALIGGYRFTFLVGLGLLLLALLIVFVFIDNKKVQHTSKPTRQPDSLEIELYSEKSRAL
jgi:EmrB/QacA subfamily drug resistance transporter